MPKSRIPFRDAAGRPVSLIPDDVTVLMAPRPVWSGVVVEQRVHAPRGEVAEHSVTGPRLHLHTGDPFHLRCRAGGEAHEGVVRTGQVMVVPSDRPLNTEWRERIDVLNVWLDPAFFARAIEELADPARVELRYEFAAPDPQAERLALTLRAELEAGCPGGRLFGDSLATALAIHLLRQYGSVRPPPPRATGLSRERLRRVLDFIAAHLGEDLSLDALARVAGMSPSYFAAQFRHAVGLPPHQYVVRERVERAKALLARRDLTLAEVSALVGFADQSHLTRHVKRVLGVTPKALARPK